MNAYKRFKRRVYDIVGSSAKRGGASSAVNIALCVLVLLSCTVVIVDLFFKPSDALRLVLERFEYIVVGIFILEYVVRIWIAEYEYPECDGRLHAVWEYITSFDSLIDILSIVSVLFNEIPKEFAMMRMIKLVKLVRLAKMSDYVKPTGGLAQKLHKLKVRVNEIIDKGRPGDIPSKAYDIVSVILILLSVSFILVETFPIPDAVHSAIYIFELVIAVFFAVEYVLRVWTAPLEFPDMRPDKARMKYIFSFISLIDLLSIVPIFVANIPNATGILKIFKLCKIIRLLKASRYLSSIANFGKAIQKKKKQIIMSVIAITVMILICSILMYSFENKEQPDVFLNGFSGVAYVIQTMLETDPEISPQTPIGQALSTLMLLLGGCMFGVPVTIIATGFEDMIAEQAGDTEEASTEIYQTLKMYDAMSETDKQRFRKIIEIPPSEDEDE